MKKWLFLPAIFALTAPAFTQGSAKQRLENSPRHGEWVTVKSSNRDLKCYIVYPEAKGKRPSVLVIHEIFGLTDWARGVADQLAEAGYVAIAPDFLSGRRGARRFRSQSCRAGGGLEAVEGAAQAVKIAPVAWKVHVIGATATTACSSGR